MTSVARNTDVKFINKIDKFLICYDTQNVHDFDDFFFPKHASYLYSFLHNQIDGYFVSLPIFIFTLAIKDFTL